MNLPFTGAQFFDVFAAYNRAFWPAVVALWMATALFSVWLLRRRDVTRALVILLAIHWAWSGIAYHLFYFADINPAARLFAMAFAVQAVGFLWSGIKTKRLRLQGTTRGWERTGAFFIGLALAYPVLSLLTGHRWPALPLFAVPCPTTLFTIGVLLMATPPAPRWLFVVPIGWALVGGSAALLLGVVPDLLLFAAALAAALRVTALRRAGFVKASDYTSTVGRVRTTPIDR